MDKVFLIQKLLSINLPYMVCVIFKFEVLEHNGWKWYYSSCHELLKF